MTDFEKQVAEALKKPIHDDGWCVNTFGVGHADCSGRCEEISKLLAPRVAAAIEASAGSAGMHGGLPAVNERIGKTAGMRVLRGASPQPPETK